MLGRVNIGGNRVALALAFGVVALVASASVPTAVLCLALQVGAFWTAVAVLVAVGVGIMLAVTSGGKKETIEIDKR